MIPSVLKSGCAKYRLHAPVPPGSVTEYHSARGGHTGVQWLIPLQKGCIVAPPEIQADLPVTAYYEVYTHVTRKSSDSELFAPGWYPDALVPFTEPVRAAHDGLFIVYLDVYAPAASAVGRHAVKLSINVGGDLAEASFTVTVHRCAVPEKSALRSCFLVCDEDIAFGEGRCDRAMKRRYYERLMDFRLNGFALPTETAFTPEQIAEEADRYFDHPRFTAYGLQNDAGGKTSARTDAYAGQIYALAAASRPGRNLLSKAYTYFYDEADEAGTTAEALGRVRAYQAALREAADAIGRDETGRFDAFRAIAGWRASVENLPCVGTIHFTSRSAELIERTGIWCPSFIRYEDRAIREKFTRIARASGKELWWYGCMGPKYPHPTYHIDDYLLSARVLGWMQYAYGIAGHLYWNAAGYTGWDADPGAPGRDVYTDPYRNGRLPAGDGFLFYPGRPFGADGPLPSLRLMSIRDGLEDYELLALAGEAAAAFGATAEPLYDGLIDNVVYDPDEARFLRRHRQLLDYLDDPMRPLPAVRRPPDRLAGESERVLAAFAVSPDGTLCLSRCGASDGRAVEVYAVPPAEKWFTVTVDLARLGIRTADRLSFTLKNFESRSLTVFVYLDGADGTFLCQSRELFENTSIAVDIPLSACPKGGGKLRLRVRNTYPREAAYPVRVALGDLIAR